MEASLHEPVLYKKILQSLAPHPGGMYIDCTLGGGGHAAGILELSTPNGRLLGIDADPEALKRARMKLQPYGKRTTLRHGNFARLKNIALEAGFACVDGVLLDLGISSDQLAAKGRGFSFQRDEPLDMRFSPDQPVTAADLVNGLSEEELANLIRRYGEESRARRIARAIVKARPVQTTGQLTDIILHLAGRRGKLHPATRTFQALRIAVNGELEALEAVLPQAVELLKPGGRLVVITFHSLEDRIVKHYMREEAKGCDGWPECGGVVRSPTLKLINRKVIRPSEEEIKKNPRSRSAKLRIAEKL